MASGFPYTTLADIYSGNDQRNFPLPALGDPAILKRPVEGQGFTLPNALAIQPMEGCDGDAQGAPTDWTVRRYRRFAAGGAGLIWLEAVAVSPESRANPNQLMLTEGNIDSYRALLREIRAAAQEAGFPRPAVIVQLTHSGRFSRPVDAKVPIRAWKSDVLDAHQSLPDDWPIVTDAELASLPAQYAASTRLCRAAGFDGVDVKACHLYLLSELLGAFDRPAPYGGRYENRMRLYFDCVDACRAEIAGGILAARVNLYDGAAAGWGVGENLSLDLREPLQMVRDLAARGVKMLNLTMGTPYFNPHVNRPYSRGGYEPPEPQLEGVGRLLHGCARAQAEAPDVVCVATGFSYLRHFAPEIAAGLIESGGAKVAAFGRGAFAYPDFAADILSDGSMTPSKCCITCGLCTKIMRAGGRPGCPVRDASWYVPELKRVTEGE